MRDRLIERTMDVLVEEAPNCSACSYRKREEFKELATHIVDAIDGEYDKITKDILSAVEDRDGEEGEGGH